MKTYTLIPTVLIKEAARGDFFLAAAQKALTQGKTLVDPAVRYKALEKITEGGGYDFNPFDALGRILEGKPRVTDSAGNVLKLLTGKGTKNTDKDIVANAVRRSTSAPTSGYSDVNRFAEILPKLVKSYAPKRQVSVLNNLGDKGIMDRLRV